MFLQLYCKWSLPQRFFVRFFVVTKKAIFRSVMEASANRHIELIFRNIFFIETLFLKWKSEIQNLNIFLSIYCCIFESIKICKTLNFLYCNINDELLWLQRGAIGSSCSENINGYVPLSKVWALRPEHSPLNFSKSRCCRCERQLLKTGGKGKRMTQN